VTRLPGDLLAHLGGDPAGVGLFLDFDGTLSEIAPTPQEARPLPGIGELLERLAGGYGLVAVVTGRPSAEVAGVLGAPRVRVFGLYGAEGPDLPPLRPELRHAVADAARAVPGARLEEKGSSIAVHVRGAPDPTGALGRLRPLLERAITADEVVLPGRLVLEVAPRAMDDKGRTVERAARDLALTGVLYAGDDLADVAAFDALDRLRDRGVATVRVTVASAEAPPVLLERADVVVDGPAGLVPLLRDLESPGRPAG
jgi:trehalose 6-phosphate phosphatase